MANKELYAICFTEWKSGQISSSLVKLCKELMNDEELLINQRKDFCGIKCKQNFSRAFHSMCNELFKYGVKKEYALVLIAFSLSLDETMTKSSDWYTTDLLIDLLSGTLNELNVNPASLNQGTEVWKGYCSRFLKIAPILFFCYYLNRGWVRV